MASSPDLESLQGKLETKYKIYKLRDALRELDGYDEIYLDTPPALNFFTLSALIAAPASTVTSAALIVAPAPAQTPATMASRFTECTWIVPLLPAAMGWSLVPT